MSENNVRQLLHGINPVPLMTNHTNFEVEDEDEEFVIEKILGKNNVMKNVMTFCLFIFCVLKMLSYRLSKCKGFHILSTKEVNDYNVDQPMYSWIIGIIY